MTKRGDNQKTPLPLMMIQVLLQEKGIFDTKTNSCPGQNSEIKGQRRTVLQVSEVRTRTEQVLEVRWKALLPGLCRREEHSSEVRELLGEPPRQLRGMPGESKD